MLLVHAREGESGEAMINRFTKLVQRDGVLREFKKRRHFVSKSEQRRLDAQRAARKRARRAAKSAARATRPGGPPRRGGDDAPRAG